MEISDEISTLATRDAAVHAAVAMTLSGRCTYTEALEQAVVALVGQKDSLAEQLQKIKTVQTVQLQVTPEEFRAMAWHAEIRAFLKGLKRAIWRRR